MGANKKKLLSAGEFRMFFQQSHANLKERNVVIPMPTKDQLNELYNAIKTQVEGISFEEVQSKMPEVQEVVLEVVKMPKEFKIKPNSNDSEFKSQEFNFVDNFHGFFTSGFEKAFSLIPTKNFNIAGVIFLLIYMICFLGSLHYTIEHITYKKMTETISI